MKNSYNQDVYDYLNGHLVSWKRINKWNIEVLTPGYCSQECVNIETHLVEADCKVTSRKFDPKSKQTVTIYKHE